MSTNLKIFATYFKVFVVQQYATKASIYREDNSRGNHIILNAIFNLLEISL